ncbi:MAG: IclR family transcriptional regulator C-terminal domain-containing protein [Paracoccaceae bacterium]
MGAAERLARLPPPLERFTESTLTRPAEVAAAAEAAWAAGRAVSRDGFEIGVTGVAAPVVDAAGACRATIAVAAPTSRIDAEGLDAILPALFSARDHLARALFG